MKISYPTIAVIAASTLAWLTPMSGWARGLSVVALAVCAVIETRRWIRQRAATR